MSNIWNCIIRNLDTKGFFSRSDVTFAALFLQECAEGGPLPTGCGVQRIQARQSQTAAARSAHQQKRLN